MNLFLHRALPLAAALALGASPLRAQSASASAGGADRPLVAPAVALLDRVSIVAAPSDWWAGVPARLPSALGGLRCDDLGPTTVAELTRRAREEGGGNADADSRAIILQVSSLPASQDACVMQVRFIPDLAGAGISMAPAQSTWPGLDPDSIVVRADGRRLAPVATSRRAMLSPRAAAPSHEHLVRVRLPADALDPDSLGRLRAVTVEVYFADASWRSYDLDSTWIAQQWAATAWSRAASLTPLPAGAARPGVPASGDLDVQRADARFADGDLRSAASILIARLRAGNAAGPYRALDASDRLHANTLVASAFALGGDPVSWRPYVSDARRDAPCLGFGPSVPEGPRRLADALRAPASECARRASDVTRLGSWLPGRGDMLAGRVGQGRAVGIASLGLFGGSVVAAMRGSSQHASYLAARDATTASAMLQQANGSRRLSGQLLVGGVVLWLGDAVIGRLMDRAHDAAVATVTGYGR